MQLRIHHTTTFTYDGKATASLNQARMTPVTTPEQIVVHNRIEVSPKPWISEYRDYFGTYVTSFEVLDPHDQLVVTATSTVQTQRQPASEPVLSWEDLTTHAVADRWTEYLMRNDLVEPPDDFVERVRRIREDAARPGEAARAVCELVYDEVEYVPGSTQVHTAAAEAWGQRAGVCQDMTHLAIGGLRKLGIPARYVSGYHHPSADPVVGETVTGESHAWLEWWDDGWHAFDPKERIAPDDRYVSVAVGRDYSDVKPISGIYSGASTSEMSVEVDVTRLD